MFNTATFWRVRSQAYARAPYSSTLDAALCPRFLLDSKLLADLCRNENARYCSDSSLLVLSSFPSFSFFFLSVTEDVAGNLSLDFFVEGVARALGEQKRSVLLQGSARLSLRSHPAEMNAVSRRSSPSPFLHMLRVFPKLSLIFSELSMQICGSSSFIMWIIRNPSDSCDLGFCCIGVCALQKRWKSRDEYKSWESTQSL